jgi:hypothetical protein
MNNDQAPIDQTNSNDQALMNETKSGRGSFGHSCFEFGACLVIGHSADHSILIDVAHPATVIS